MSNPILARIDKKFNKKYARYGIQFDLAKSGKIISFHTSSKKISTKPTPMEILGYNLFPAQEKWIDFCYNSNTKVSLLLTSREYGKTDTISVYDVINILLANPLKTFLISTKEFSRTQDIINAIGYHLKAHGKSGKFTDSLIHLHERIGFKQPNVKAITPRASSIRGNHADYVICDDVVIDGDEYSKAEHRRIVNFYDGLFDVAKKIIVLGQPVHENDLYTHIKAKHKENPNMVGLLENFAGTIPELDKNLDNFRSAGKSERSIQKNYLGKLILDERFPFANLNIVNYTQGTNCIACIDTAWEGTDNIGIAIGYKDINNNHSYMVYEISANVYDKVNLIVQLLTQHNVYKCFIEHADHGGVLRAFKNTSCGIVLKGYKETIKKETRIRSRICGQARKMVVSGDIKNLITWSDDAATDDVADALSSCINMMNGNKDKVKIYNR